MAGNKKYYWIKLKTDFFDTDKIDFLLSQDNGCEYVVLYQMLCTKTANTNGMLATQMGEVIIPYDANKIARDTKYFSIDTIIVALELYKKLGLIYESNDGNLMISNYSEMVGSETTSAIKKREYRQKLKEKEQGQSERQCLGQLEDNVRQEIEIREKSLEFRYKSKEKDKKETYVSILDAYTDNENLKKSLQDYVEMRNKMKGFTTRALKLNLNELDKLADDIETKINIVNQSIKKSWKSFYKLKSEDYTKTKELPSWYHDQSNIKIDNEDFNEAEMIELQNQLRGGR